MPDLTGRTRITAYQYKKTPSRRKPHRASTKKCNEDEEVPSGTNAEHSSVFQSSVGVNCNIRHTSLLDGNLGGLRGDPFMTYPIESKGYVPSAFDYFAEVYAPFAVRPSGIHTPARRLGLFQVIFRTMLNDAMLFEEIVSFSIVIQMLGNESRERLSRAVLYHTNNAIIQLRKRLSSEMEGTSDAVVMTIILLAYVHHILGDLKAFRIHAEALRQIVKGRGGLDSLGWDGYLKEKALVVEGASNVLRRTEHLTPTTGPVVTIPLQDGRHNARADYPSHPFPPELCNTISGLSPGFRLLALSTKLSLQCIGFLALLGPWIHQEHKSFTGSMTSGVISMPGRTRTERLLACVLLAYVTFVEWRVMRYSNPVAELHLNLQMKIVISENPVRPTVHLDDRDLLAWACLTIRATTKGGILLSDSWRWADQTCRALGMIEDSTRKRELEEVYFPIPNST